MDDDEILLQNVIGGVDNLSKKDAVESLLIDDQAN